MWKAFGKFCKITWVDLSYRIFTLNRIRYIQFLVFPIVVPISLRNIKFSQLELLKSRSSLCEDNQPTNSTDDKGLNKIANELRKIIQPIRTILSNQWQRKEAIFPTFQLVECKYEHGHIHCLELIVPLDIFQFSHAQSWMKECCIFVFSKVEAHARPSANDFRASLEDFRSFFSDPDRKKLVIRGSQNVSLYVNKLRDEGNNHKISFVLLKDGGFTTYDISEIGKGYRVSFCPEPMVDPSLKSAPFGFNRTPFDLSSVTLLAVFAEEQRAIALARPPSDPQGDKIGGGGALSALASMGVEVFDGDSEEKLDWDALAGCRQIKQQLQETILNALQYPDLYDHIAQRTRVRFESNRPKAVLLEGPPGTGTCAFAVLALLSSFVHSLGKTLTARILASQIVRPLVVLHLESILSKWYGDSEKRLSKVRFEYIGRRIDRRIG